eukprot:397076-Pyramimonas_sp.AAC.1
MSGKILQARRCEFQDVAAMGNYFDEFGVGGEDTGRSWPSMGLLSQPTPILEALLSRSRPSA